MERRASSPAGAAKPLCGYVNRTALSTNQFVLSPV